MHYFPCQIDLSGEQKCKIPSEIIKIFRIWHSGKLKIENWCLKKKNHIGISRYKIAFQIKIFSNFKSKVSTFKRNVLRDAYRITDEFKMGHWLHTASDTWQWNPCTSCIASSI